MWVFSVVNALTSKLHVEVKRGGQIYEMEFANGDKQTELTEIGSVGKANTGTTITFWPDAKYFDSNKISVLKLKHVLRAKAVLCPGLMISLSSEQTEEDWVWHYENGLKEYLLDRVGDVECFPETPFMAESSATTEAVEWGGFVVN